MEIGTCTVETELWLLSSTTLNIDNCLYARNMKKTIITSQLHFKSNLSKNFDVPIVRPINGGHDIITIAVKVL